MLRTVIFVLQIERILRHRLLNHVDQCFEERASFTLAKGILESQITLIERGTNVQVQIASDDSVDVWVDDIANTVTNKVSSHP